MNIWVTADLHLGHKAILTHTPRPFTEIEVMNTYLIDKVNKYVKRNDLLIIAGDVFWSRAGHFRQRLAVRNLWVTQGNHDSSSLRSHVSRMEYMIFLKKKHLTICHYPLESWPWMELGGVHLHGHCHGRLTKRPGRVDVGVDAVFNDYGEYRPLNLDEICS